MNKEIKYMIAGIIAGIGLGLAIAVPTGMVAEILKLDNKVVEQTEVREHSVTETIYNLRERLDIYVTNEIISNGKYKESSGLVNTLELHRIANSLDDLVKVLKTDNKGE